MPVLHIEHAITDLDTWKSAFDRFAAARASAGVHAHRIAQPMDDDSYIIVELDFADVRAAEGFLNYLRDNVWSLRDASPALAGEPQTRILMEVENAVADHVTD
jgi:hypothetical protein